MLVLDENKDSPSGHTWILEEEAIDKISREDCKPGGRGEGRGNGRGEGEGGGERERK